ncbi:DUF6431 domain-containing protein [Anaerosolibacter sp.]|uniref:DUF6431 domain-containing protein n=1 Tax=Anaerosolibacter sp. TaxID=1872527 RepID=UPI0039EE04A3
MSQKDFVCPKCEGSTHFHGFYERKLKFADSVIVTTIARVKCTFCNATHAVLPDFISPRKHYSAAEVEDVIVDKENGTPDEHIDSSASVSTIKRWLKAFNSKAPNILGALQSILFSLYGVIASAISISTLSWLSRIKDIINQFPDIECSNMILSKTNLWILSHFQDIYI